MEDNGFSNRYSSNEHNVNLIRMAYSIDAKANFFKYADTGEEERVTSIASLFKCHIEKFHKFLCFGTYHNIVLDICDDIELFEIQEHQDLAEIREIMDVYKQLGYGFTNSRLDYAKANEVTTAVNEYITSQEILYALK